MTKKQELEKALEAINKQNWGYWLHVLDMDDTGADQKYKQEVTDIIRHVLTQALREDVVMVPRTPDLEMGIAGLKNFDCSIMSAEGRMLNIRKIYISMIDAHEKNK